MAARAVAFLCAAAMVCVPSVSFGQQAEAKRYAGRTVVDVLKELQTTSLKIIFSSERVPPALRVIKEPRATSARDIALQILEPHGLTLEQGPGGTSSPSANAKVCDNRRPRSVTLPHRRHLRARTFAHRGER